MLLENVKDKVVLPCGVLLPRDASEEQKAQLLGHFGVSSENDPVEFEVSVASLVYDIYDATVELPKAPFNRAREKANRVKMVEEFSKTETLFLKPEVEAAVKRALTDDATWTKVKIGVTLRNQKTDLLEADALDLFPKAREALLKLCEG